ncbi:SDR family NAD(P)-dependent oxidoreductase [Dialister micraerophilus]|uniref:NADP-dependent L-serine/L-allo-threonine dehydrogenase YdfG n=1 Tax=Dialister micraerophilus DSM 19965 TaxID=888062 RepID=F2BXW1_9FIRM|nr:SDR family NAD(P)-dependent oxidoreductase [Dialister micraerophilus]EGF12899.1 NADP-dependent L-serine/L-allo-threonine dehydrogenase YdfG [Dialister micraerophilus DSM 19965]MDU5301267.1 SDR family NAD(P)-dependent oxidoreductase [Dialister micraerophilus]
MKKTALITGAGSGIGRETARAFAIRGYNIILCGRNQEKLLSIQKELTVKYEAQAYVKKLDVTDVENINAVAKECLEEFEGIDVLVNNAGLARGLEPYNQNREDGILEMIDTNIKGLMMMTREFLPSMLEHNTGHIINIGSTAGLYAYAGGAVYCATKSAVKTFSDGVRIDVIDSNIKVTTIQPGLVETPFSEVRFRGDKERAAKVYEDIDALQAQDIAEIIAFTVSQPLRVQISDIVIMANQQATGFTISKKKK